jgi:ketosteroid isomerase-like protein
MRHFRLAVRIFALAVVAVPVACAGAAPASTPAQTALTAEDREAIQALAAGYSAHALAGDFDAWADLYHPDAVRMNPGAPPMEGREAIRQWAHGLNIAVRAHEMSPREVEGTRELGYIRGTYRSVLGAVVDGEEITIVDAGSWLAVVRRDDADSWRFYRFIYNAD